MYSVTKDFLGKPAPPGYVAGLGRGASGFTTRSDIGPAREAAAAAGKEAADDAPDGDNDAGLFSNTPYEADDAEADRVWAQVDEQMEQRRRGKRKDQDDSTGDAPAIDDELRGLKRQLESVTEDEWLGIPDALQIAEAAARAKRRRKSAVSRRGERYSQVSDRTLVAGLGGAAQGLASEDQSAEARTDLVALGQARVDVLGLALDRQSAGSVQGVDATGYLTSLGSLGGAAKTAEIGDLERARELLRSVTQANPHHAPAWIAAARVEEMARKPSRARALISEACERCPRSTDVWLEAARLHPQEARAILASGARHLPQSEALWMRAAELEPAPMRRKRVLRRALEHCPQSADLWKLAVSLEDDENDARVLLAHAVELCPGSLDLWLALARLETREMAQRVLNRARRALPGSPDVWVHAARLEEHHGAPDDRLLRVMQKAVAALQAALDRAQWLRLAVSCAEDGCPATCRAIVQASADLGFDDDDTPAHRAAIWMSDAQGLAAECLTAARALRDLALTAHPTDIRLWRTAIDMERTYASQTERSNSLAELLERATQECPAAEVLWLMRAKHQWVELNDIPAARATLEHAYAANPTSENVLLAAVKLESQGQRSLPRALALLTRARDTQFHPGKAYMGTPRIWLKSAVLLRENRQDMEALQLCHKALQWFADMDKLWLVRAQIEQSMGGPDHLQTTRKTLSLALKSCTQSVPLWMHAARLEKDSFGSPARARAVLERARVHVPKNPVLWLESVRLEALESLAVARTLLSVALQECPKAGALWAETILLAERPQRKARSVDALKKAEPGDALVTCMVARLFWAEAKMDKARAWFERACAADKDNGDIWAWRLRFEMEQKARRKVINEDLSEGDLVSAVENACVSADPHHGEMWPCVAKHPDNARLSTIEVLHKVAEALSTTTRHFQ
ncbi:U4/U6 x U5 tri-snRNP complex subunit Prp1 [Coemansia sp. Benny D115]|nr:U4/U6 x U5 tri-snRNP complex subunit Prp1 [Coemansia sp. Benny D115]